MSVPSEHIIDSLEPYLDFVHENQPTLVIEKPYGCDRKYFNYLKMFSMQNNLKVLYNDHYVFKEDMMKTDPSNVPSFLYTIDLIFHEVSDPTHRKGYDGILLDMYQSHALVVISKVLTDYFKNKISRTEILEELSQITPTIVNMTTHMCIIKFLYRGVNISVSCGKLMPFDKKVVLVNKRYYMGLEDSNVYDRVIGNIIEDDTKMFLNSYEVDCLWRHIS